MPLQVKSLYKMGRVLIFFKSCVIFYHIILPIFLMMHAILLCFDDIVFEFGYGFGEVKDYFYPTTKNREYAVLNIIK